MSWRARALWAMDRFFPPDVQAFMTDEQQTVKETIKAPERVGAYLEELGRTDVDICDFGCGWGGETLWLAERVRSATGVDIDPRNLEQANRALDGRAIANCRFVLASDDGLNLPDDSFDAVFSTNTFEHVQDLDQAFREIYRILRPGGLLIARWGPLFYSPQGYHLYWACQVPYAHVAFGLDAVVALRNARAPRPLQARSWRDLGLNQKRFADYRNAAQHAGFSLERFRPVAVRSLDRLARLPVIGDLLIFGVDCRIRKPF